MEPDYVTGTHVRSSLSSAFADDREMHAGGREGGERVKVRFPLGQSTMGKITVRFQRTLHPEGENGAALSRDCPCSYKKKTSPLQRVQLQLVALLKYHSFFSLQSFRLIAIPLAVHHETPPTSCEPEALKTIVTRSRNWRRLIADYRDGPPVKTSSPSIFPRVSGDETFEQFRAQRHRYRARYPIIAIIAPVRVIMRTKYRNLAPRRIVHFPSVITRNFQQKLRGS